MRVVLLGDMSGTRDGQQWPPRGSTIDLPDEEAAQLCHQGMAKPAVDLQGDVEMAVVPADEERRVSGLTTDTGPGRKARSIRSA